MLDGHTAEEHAKGRGRRPDPEKRDQIVAAAAELFAVNGFSVSVGKIAEQAGVSKQTIYNLFGTKQDLFGAVVSKCSGEVTEAIPTQPTEQPVDEALYAIAMNFMEFLVSNKIPNVYRLMLQAPEDVAPELIERFYEMGPYRGLQRMTKYLQALHDNGALHIPNPELAAESFFGILKGHIIIQNMLGLRQEWPREELQNRVQYCVSMFLRMHSVNNI